MAQTVKNLPEMQETQVLPMGWEDPLEKGMATHSNVLAWRIPWTEELPSMGLQRVRHDWVTNTFIKETFKTLPPLKVTAGTSLVVQRLKIWLPVQRTQVRSLVQEDPTCRRAAKPELPNYWAHVLELVLCNKRSHRSETPVHRSRE